MEVYSSHSSASSSTCLPQYAQQEAKGFKVTQSFQESLHSVRKPPAKPWKKPIAPFPPTPPRLYKVDPLNFRDLVQKLTGAPQSQPQRLQRLSPPPLNIAKPSTPSLFQRDVGTPLQLIPSPAKTSWSALYQDLMSETLETNPQKASDYLIPSTSLGLSPSSHSWCSYPLLSPGTLSTLEQSTVL